MKYVILVCATSLMALGGYCGFLIGGYVKTQEWQKISIEYGSGQYNSRTGEFELVKCPNAIVLDWSEKEAKRITKK